MQKKQNFQQPKTTLAVLDYIKREPKKEAILKECMRSTGDKNRVHVPEIITPHPYGLFTLCQHYEHFQRN